jgi:hypothetical protein
MPIRQSRERGRPRGRYHKLADYSSLDYIGLISMKYGFDAPAFFRSLIEAWQHQESTYKNLSIECRMKTRDNAFFLITEGFKVVAQFPLTKNVLNETNPLKEFAYIKKTIKKTDNETIERSKIKDLRVGMKRIKLEAKVMEISKPNSVYTREGKLNLVANAKITDKTGIINLPLWNQQIHTIAVGDIIQVENANIVAFRGERQLRLRRTGKMSVIEKD